MSDGIRDLVQLVVGDRTAEELRAALASQSVALNESAQELLSRKEMAVAPATVQLVTLTPADVGLPDGGTLSEVLAAAGRHGLHPCPLATGPYLRLVHSEAASSDPELRRHRPPDGALHVASPVLDPSFDVPKGFYLRTVEGQRWLRGYRCDDDYVVPADTTYVFRR